MSLKILALVALAFIFAAGECAAQPRDWMKNVRKQTMTYSAIPLETPISVEVKGRVFNIPVGYFYDWPEREELNKLNHYKWLNLIFWMPSKKYPEFSGPAVADSYVQMLGEPFDPSAYIVHAHVHIQKIDEPGYVSPWQRSENEMRPYPGDGQLPWVFEATPNGLQHFWRVDLSNYDRQTYRNFKAQDPQLFLTCDTPESKLPNPLCAGDIHFVNEDIAFFIMFPADKVADWKSIVFAVRDLVRSWEIKPTSQE